MGDADIYFLYTGNLSLERDNYITRAAFPLLKVPPLMRVTGFHYTI